MSQLAWFGNTVFEIDVCWYQPVAIRALVGLAKKATSPLILEYETL